MWRFWILNLFLFALSIEARDYHGARLIPFEQFKDFHQSSSNGTLILISPVIPTDIAWNQLVPSWNYRAPSGAGDAGITVEVMVIYPGHQTKWYSFGSWSAHPGIHARESIKGQQQRDDDGTVATDTLEMHKHGGSLRLRITLTNPDISALKLLTLSLCDMDTKALPLAPEKSAWGKTLTVKERSQANYPEGISSWCSPTTVSMLLSHWSAALHRPDLDHDVPEVAAGVNDPNWPGTGNWPFNMAFAATHPGIRAYVSRLSDISELEQWINAGIPVGVSVSYGWLRGKPERGNGHLVVCIGFTENGDPIFNDPGRSQVRQIYKRADLEKAWAESEHTVYLVYPEGTKTPRDRFSHWMDDEEDGAAIRSTTPSK